MLSRNGSSLLHAPKGCPKTPDRGVGVVCGRFSLLNSGNLFLGETSESAHRKREKTSHVVGHHGIPLWGRDDPEADVPDAIGAGGSAIRGLTRMDAPTSPRGRRVALPLGYQLTHFPHCARRRRLTSPLYEGAKVMMRSGDSLRPITSISTFAWMMCLRMHSR